MSKGVFVQNPVNKLMQDAVRGRSSRRELIKRGSALGLSGALMGPILKAASVGAQATPDASPAGDQPVGWALTQPEWLDVDLSGQTVNAVLAAEGEGAPWDQAVCDFFAQATGATVNYIRGAESATDRLTYYNNILNSEASDFDFFTVDVIWPGILARHAEDLSEIADELAAEDATFFSRILENNRVGDTLVSLPAFTDAGVLYSRTDLLDKYGLEVPTTWDDLENAAQVIQEGEVGEGNSSFNGYTFQAAAYEGLTCNALEWVYSHGGGSFIEPDGTVTANSDEAKAAIERAVGWIGNIAPSAVTNYMEEDGRIVWQGGNSAFHRNWPYVYAISQADDSELQDNFQLGLLPAGDGGHAATLGGWNAMVSRYAENMDAAKLFAKFWSSKEVQKSRAIERTQNPTVEEVYDDPDVQAAAPFFADLYDVFAEGSVARPSLVTADLYNDASVAIFTAVNQLLTGQNDDVSGAMDDLASELESIVDEV